MLFAESLMTLLATTTAKQVLQTMAPTSTPQVGAPFTSTSLKDSGGVLNAILLFILAVSKSISCILT